MINLEKAIELAKNYKEQELDKKSELLGYLDLPGSYAFSCAIPNTETDAYIIIVNKDNGVVTKKFIMEFFKQIKGYDPEFKEFPKQEEKEVENLFGF